MAYQTQKIQRNKDPFTVQPLPKSFYHPSPTKQVDVREAIKSPQKLNPPNTLCAQEEEEFLRETPTFQMSAFSNVRSSGDLAMSRSYPQKQGDAFYNETWPENDRTSSMSISGDTSNITSTTLDSEAANPHTNIGDVIMHLERFKQQTSSAGPHKTKISNDAPVNDGGDSVLKRYIDRFRNSAPKPREERIKEKGDNGQFWWLQVSPCSRTGSVDRDKVKNPSETKYRTEPLVTSQLTKEALLTLDEESYNLQSRADRLLSKSELSLTSSGPFVSTEGLGSSSSVSAPSVCDDQVPYKPSFLHVQENYNRLRPKPSSSKEERSRIMHNACDSTADDILTRWRLRRKMEEANQTRPSGHLDELSHVKPPVRHAELDTRLEEFRKKILSQKALVTQEDILFERHKMTMLIEDIKQDGGSFNKEIAQTQGAIQNLEKTKDTILERLQKITGSGDSRKGNNAATAGLGIQAASASFSAFPLAADYNFSINNASFAAFGASDLAAASSTLNKNNTASQNMYINNSLTLEPIVDSFESQVVCDPKTGGFFLGSSSGEANRRICDGVKDVGVKELSIDRGKAGEEKCSLSSERQKVEAEKLSLRDKAEVEKLAQDKTPADHQNESTTEVVGNSLRIKKQFKVSDKTDDILCGAVSRAPYDSLNKEREAANIKLQNGKMKSVKKLKSNAEHIEQKESGSGEEKSKESEGCSDRAQKQVSQRTSDNFYQFLEAEKPVSENEKKKGKKDKMMPTDERNQHERRRKIYSGTEKHMEINGERGLVKDTENRRHRTKVLSINDEDEDSAGSDVLTDITNESSVRSGKSSNGMNSWKNINDSKKTVSSENNNEKSYVAKLAKKIVPLQDNFESSPIRSASQGRRPVQHAIGQAITDHLFDGSTLASSSVDSWASIFPQSPSQSHSLHVSTYSGASPASSKRDSSTLASIPVIKTPSDQQVHDDESESDGEFPGDPLLQILRKQRKQYLQQLQCIEERLQTLDS